MTVLYLLDTDIASNIIKSRSVGVEAKLASIPPESVAISAVTQAELLYGLKRLPLNHPLQPIVLHFLRIVKVLPWPPEAAGYYAEIRHQLLSTGQPIGEMDMMIAAHALALDATLVTNNMRHYERIALQVRIENWTV